VIPTPRGWRRIDVGDDTILVPLTDRTSVIRYRERLHTVLPVEVLVVGQRDARAARRATRRPRRSDRGVRGTAAVDARSVLATVCYDPAMAKKKQKRFKVAANEIKTVVSGFGGCIATDKITVDGEPVAYMIRNEPAAPEDSGWMFMSGTESQAYMNDAANMEVYAVNTIANYDPDIIPFLDAPTGSSYERSGNEGPFEPCDGTDWEPGDAATSAPKWPPPGFPIVEGVHALSGSWSLTLPAQFTRRIDDGALVLWRPGITLWNLAYTNDKRDSQAKRLAGLKDEMSDEATDIRETTTGGVTRLTYFVNEDGQRSLTSIAVSDAGHLHTSIYFDDEADAATALRIAQSITATS